MKAGSAQVLLALVMGDRTYLELDISHHQEDEVFDVI